MNIEPHRVAEVRRILLQDHLREGDRPFRSEGGKGQAPLQIERFPRFGQKDTRASAFFPCSVPSPFTSIRISPNAVLKGDPSEASANRTFPRTAGWNRR